MNKRDRETISSIIAGWEWIQGGSASEAAGIARCARQLREEFAVTAEELSFPRGWAIAGLLGIREDQDALDRLLDEIDADYEALLVKLEARWHAAGGELAIGFP
jgi:hypothetical protein